VAPAAPTDVDPTTPTTTTENSPERSPERLPGTPGGNGGPGSADPSLEEAEPTGFVPAAMAELRKVVWPSRQQLFSESVAVILMVGLSAAAIAAIDRLYRWISLQVFR
jgi:preprotein translocase subunit SecE